MAYRKRPSRTSTRTMCASRAGRNSGTRAVPLMPTSMAPAAAASGSASGVSKRWMPAQAPADVGFDDHGEGESLRRGRRPGGVVDHPGARNRQAEAPQQRILTDFGRLEGEGAAAVHDVHAEAFQVAQEFLRVVDGAAVAAEVGGRAHPIEDDRPR